MTANAPQIAELSDELAELANAACNGTLSAEQRHRLDQLLLDDESAQLSYVTYLNIHSQLHWSYRGGALGPARVPSDREHSTTPTSRARHRRIGWAAACAVAAALIAIAFFAWYDPYAADESSVVSVPITPDELSSVEVSVAACSDSPDAVWEMSEGSTIAGASPRSRRLSAGVHILQSGVVEIELDAGARATLSGLTEIELTDGHEIHLPRGQLAVLVRPEASSEFVVQTPHAKIVDRGTEFAVVVDAAGTLVHVYEGRVEAEFPSGEIYPILPDTTMRISADGPREPIDVSFERWRFARSRKLAVAEGQDAAFAAPRFEPVVIDERHFTRVGEQPLHNQDNKGNNLAELPKGWRPLPEFPIPFQIGDGVMQLGSSRPHMADLRDKKIEEIEVHKRCAALHFLQATGDLAADQTQVGEYVIHYEDGEEATFPIVYGRNTSNWWDEPDGQDPKPLPKAVVAWRGQNEFVRNTKNGRSLALYAATWENPHPDKLVKSLEMRTSAEHPAAPFCVAITSDRKPDRRADADGEEAVLSSED